MSNMARLERIVAARPETVRVDIEEWGGEPTFRVNNKAFVFTDQEGTGVCVKLTTDEAAAVVATDPTTPPPTTGSVGTAGSRSNDRLAPPMLAAARGIGARLTEVGDDPGHTRSDTNAQANRHRT